MLNGLCVSVHSAMARVRKDYVEHNDDQDPQLIEKILPYYRHPAYSLAGSQLAGMLCAAVYILCLAQCWRCVLAVGVHMGIVLPFWGKTAAAAALFLIAMTAYWIFTVRIPGDAALTRPIERIAGRTWLLSLIRRTLHPLTALGVLTSRKVLRLRGLPATNEAEFTYSEEEIRCIVEESHRGGKLSALENLLIKNSFDFFDLMTQEIMIPRSEMTVLYYGDSMDHMRRVISSSHHTCYPLCMEDKDHIIGFIHVKDFLEAAASGETDVKRIVRNILTVPEVMPTPKLLQLMRRRRIYLAVVVDEYGSTAGLVTLEDIIEELIGEIPQEMDTAPGEILKKDDGSYEFDGLVILDDISDRLGIEFDEAGSGNNTIGGYMFSLLERIPKAGDTVRIGQWLFTVLRMEGFRIIRVKAEHMPEAPEPAEADGREDAD